MQRTVCSNDACPGLLYLYPIRILTVRFANVPKDIRLYLFLVLQSLSM